ncbi:MAG: YCF48-related protein, partial [Myxococcota bacterium]|jgi:photosystem II stability/assembly factor-like uncharacterized protein|nr:YCF48-related protein [Myxococcota bacterium]
VRTSKNEERVIYQLEGSRIFAEEAMMGSQLEKWFAASRDESGQVMVETIDLQGRLLSFAEDDEGIYRGLRDYYRDKYGMTFCVDMSKAELEKARAELGRGGLTISSNDEAISFVEGESGTRASLTAVSFVPGGEKAYAVGSNGTLLESSDGGATWFDKPLVDTRNFNDVAFASGGELGFVVGERSALLRTMDGAERFEQAYPYIDQALYTVHVSQDGKRVLVGGAEGLILGSDDGGRRWTPRPLVNQPHLRDVLRLDGGVLLVVGDEGLLLRSEDQGMTWTRQVSQSVNTLWDVLALSAQRVLVVGEGNTVLYSDDAGSSWNRSAVRVVPGLEFGWAFHAAAFHADGLRGVFVGRNGALGRSEDGGFNVELRSHSHATRILLDVLGSGGNLPEALGSVREVSNLPSLHAAAGAGEQVFAVGRDNTLLVSRDGGKRWQRRALPLEEKHDLWAIAFATETEGYIGGARGLLLHTKDGGLSWTRLETGTERSLRTLLPVPNSVPPLLAYAGSMGLWGYCRPTESKCYLRAGSSELDFYGIALSREFSTAATMGVILVGESASLWAVDEQRDERQQVWHASPLDLKALAVAKEALPMAPNLRQGHMGLAVGKQGALMRSLNRGLSFVPEASGSSEELNAVALSRDARHAFVGGARGTLLYDQDAKSDWQPRPAPSQEDILSMLYLEQQKRLVVLTSSAVFYSDDQALTWTRAHEAEATLRGMRQFGERLFALGDASQLYYSDDAATTWSRVSLPGEHALRDMSQNDAVTVLVGTRGTVLSASAGELVFRAQTSGSSADLLAVVSSKAGFWASASDATLLFSATGTVWERKAPPFQSALVGAFEQDGMWFVGAGQALLYSADGEHWSARASIVSAIHDLAFFDDEVGLAVGDDGTVLKSTDGGQSWFERSSRSKENLYAVAVEPNGNAAVALGSRGAAVRSRSRGDIWTSLDTQLPDDFFAVQTLPFEHSPLLLAGDKGMLFSSDFKLARLEPLSVPRLESLRGIAFDPATGSTIVVGGSAEQPESICEDGYIILPGVTPSSYWHFFAIALALAAVVLLSIYSIIKQIRLFWAD